MASSPANRTQKISILSNLCHLCPLNPLPIPSPPPHFPIDISANFPFLSLILIQTEKIILNPLADQRRDPSTIGVCFYPPKNIKA